MPQATHLRHGRCHPFCRAMPQRHQHLHTYFDNLLQLQASHALLTHTSCRHPSRPLATFVARAFLRLLLLLLLLSLLLPLLLPPPWLDNHLLASALSYDGFHILELCQGQAAGGPVPPFLPTHSICHVCV